MKKRLSLAVLALLVASGVQAVILDDEPAPTPKPAIKPKSQSQSKNHPISITPGDRFAIEFVGGGKLIKQTLWIREQVDTRTFIGHIKGTSSDGDEHSQDARITVQGQQLDIQCYNASYDYRADHFKLRLINRDTFNGTNNDGKHLNENVSMHRLKKETGPHIEMVALPTGILMGKYEVTQGQWRTVMGSNPSEVSSCGDDCPVERVSWNDVQQFIQRLNQMMGKYYRLPSEEEWYAACQAGNDDNEYCGSNSIDAVAWYDSNSEKHTHRVGQKQPNAWGLYDMSGNVWEWTDTCHDEDCSQRVNRGGSWYNEPESVRSADRNGNVTSFRHGALGFRLAQDR